jgi:hypothetical protein
VDHFEAFSPLLAHQHDLLTILNAERRLRHVELKNKGKTQREFEFGDVVIVWKQVKSQASKGISAKLIFKAKGPYRVIEAANAGSYWLQKLPFAQGLGQPGKLRKESAARMSKLPTTLILHKCTDGMDSRYSRLAGSASNTPLEKWLGCIKHGAYKQANVTNGWAFDRLDSMWSKEVVETDSSDDDDDEGPNAHEAPVLPPVLEEGTGNEANTNEDKLDETHSESSRQRRKKRKRKAEGESGDELTAARWTPSSKPKRELRKLKQQINDSVDCLFFLCYTPNDGEESVVWHLGQVNKLLSSPDCSDVGVYTVQWWTVVRSDWETLRLPLWQCHFWPDVRKARSDGSVGESYAMRPNKVRQVLARDKTLRWESTQMCVAELMLVGPFNFSSVRTAMQGSRNKSISKYFHVDEVYWQQLEKVAPARGIDVSDVRLALPTDKV